MKSSSSVSADDGGSSDCFSDSAHCCAMIATTSSSPRCQEVPIGLDIGAVRCAWLSWRLTYTKASCSSDQLMIAVEHWPSCCASDIQAPSATCDAVHYLAFR